MRRFLLTLLCIAAISAAVFYVISVPHERTDIRAAGGALDLSGVTLGGDVFALGGKWEFYWDRLYEPADFARGIPDDEKTFIETPMAWNGAGYSRVGRATYRLLLKLPKGEDAALYIPEILSASAVWVNGERVFSAGRHGTGAKDSVPYSKNDILPLRGHGGMIEIIVQASNYHRMNGGVRHAFRAGSERELLRWALSRWLLISALSGAFFLTGFYYLMLYLLSWRSPLGERIYLVFAVCCALAGIRFLIEQDSVAQFFPLGALNTFINPIYWILFTVHTGFIVVFSAMAFELELSRWMKISLALLLAAPLLMMWLPAPLNRFGLFLNIAALLVPAVLGARVLDLNRVRDRPYLGLFLAGLLCYAFWGPVANGPAWAFFFAAPVFSNTFIMLSQCVMLSLDYAETKRRERELAAKTDFYHRVSHDLLTPLTIVSTNIQVANMKPETDHERLADSQAEIMKMAGMINSALTEGRDEEGADG
jgi:signal transduction histidine kinase